MSKDGKFIFKYAMIILWLACFLRVAHDLPIILNGGSRADRLMTMGFWLSVAVVIGLGCALVEAWHKGEFSNK